MVVVSPGVLGVDGGNAVQVSLTCGGIGLTDGVVVAGDGSPVVVSGGLSPVDFRLGVLGVDGGNVVQVSLTCGGL
ncbi:hypothetical protein Tco_1108437 [Tanacetum coccineum]